MQRIVHDASTHIGFRHQINRAGFAGDGAQPVGLHGEDQVSGLLGDLRDDGQVGLGSSVGHGCVSVSPVPVGVVGVVWAESRAGLGAL